MSRSTQTPPPGAKARRGTRLGAALRPEWMVRNVSILMAARLPISAARALASVIVPIYLALIGFSAIELGAFFLVAGLAAALISGISGPLSDRIGRRVFLVVIPGFAAAAAAVFAVTTNPVALFTAAAFGTFGRGAGAGAGQVGPYMPVESAVVATSAPARWRNAAFGRLAAASSLGAVAGGLLALVVGDAHLSAHAAFVAYRPAFVLAAVLAAATALAGLGVVETHDADTPVGREVSRQARNRKLRFPRRSLPLLIRLWVANSINGVAAGLVGPFVTYWFFRRYGVGPAELGILFAVVNAVTVLSGLGAAGVARRLGLLRAVVVTRGVQAALLIPLALAPNFWLASLVFLIRMVIARVALPLRQSFVLAAADPEELASVAALSNVPSQLTMAGSPVVTGYLFDEVSLSLPFILGGVLMGINAVLYWVFFRSIVPEEERATSQVPDDVPVAPPSGPGPSSAQVT